MKPVISICASANRIIWWERFLQSLRGNTVPYEVIFVGNVKPEFDMSLYPEFKWIYATVKPCQCYQIAFWEAKGDLLHWTADDASYDCASLPHHLLTRLPRDIPPNSNCLDRAYKLWQDTEAKYNNDGKTVIAFRPIEDGGDVQVRQHYFFGACDWTPRMAPFALVPRKYLTDKGGYDTKFVAGQCENDIIMQVFEDGGRVEIAMDAMIYVHHHQVHVRDPQTGREKNDFRGWYPKDREALENAWVKEGYGLTAKFKDTNILRQNVTLSKTRLIPVTLYQQTPDVCTVTQGERGKWL